MWKNGDNFIVLVIVGIGFLFDAETAHHERAISADGRNMRSDIETLRRVAGLRVRQNRGIARGWFNN